MSGKPEAVNAAPACRPAGAELAHLKLDWDTPINSNCRIKIDRAAGSRMDGERVIRNRVGARVGLLGNPSDIYGGACLSLSIDNFCAEARFLFSAPEFVLSSTRHRLQPTASKHNAASIAGDADACRRGALPP